MKVTLELPDEWEDCLPSKEGELAEVVAAGLRRRRSRTRHELDSLSDVMDTLAELPSPEEVLALRPFTGTLREDRFFAGEEARAGTNGRGSD
jgi:hypothetical protein